MESYQYIIFKKPCNKWYFGDKNYNESISQKIDDAMKDMMDKLNSCNSDKNIFDLLYYCHRQTVVHTINLKERTVMDMSTLKKYQLHK